MNDEAARQGRPDNHHHLAHRSAAGGRRVLRLLPTPAIVYGRAACIERAAIGYGNQGHARRLELGLGIAARVEQIADEIGRAAA